MLFNHYAEPLFPYFPDDTLGKIVVWSFRLGDVVVIRILSNVFHKVGFPTALLLRTIECQTLRPAKIVNELP